MSKKENSVLLRLSDAELKELNDGWYEAVKLYGRPLSRTEYIKRALQGMARAVRMEMEARI